MVHQLGMNSLQFCDCNPHLFGINMSLIKIFRHYGEAGTGIIILQQSRNRRKESIQKSDEPISPMIDPTLIPTVM